MRGDKARVSEATRIFRRNIMFNLPMFPSSRQLTHLRSGTLGSERPFMFAVCSTGTRPLGQAIFGTWTRHSTPGHMLNLRAAGRLMPVAQASNGVPLCLLGKRSRIALNPEPRQFLRFFDFEAETIETRSLRHAAALAANRRGANRQGAP
jgi:hypothetical protein